MMRQHVDRIALAMVVAMLASFSASCVGAEAKAPARKAVTQRVVAAKVQAVPAKAPRRFGSVIELRPEKKDYYIKIHAETWPTILKRIRKSNIRNYSIYMAEIEGKLYLFSYLEYIGDDYDADMKAIGDDPETKRWWKETDPCQKRLSNTPEGEQWLSIPEVFHAD